MCRKTAQWIPLVAIVAVGCATGGKSVDSVIRQASESGYLAMSESTAEEAIDQYRVAVHRAWGLNDHREIELNALNLASALVATERYAESQVWLLESLAEARLAGSDGTETRLLQARVLTELGDLAAARCTLNAAECAAKSSESCCGGSALETNPLDALPCCSGSCLKKELEKRKRRSALQAQVAVQRAEVALLEGDVATAKKHIKTACQTVPDSRSTVAAGIQRVSGKVSLAEGRYANAVQHFWNEAEILRANGRYRQMVEALEEAGKSAEAAGQLHRAGELYFIAARSQFGRELLTDARRLLARSVLNVAPSNCVPLQQRVSLLAQAIDSAASKEQGDAAGSGVTTQSRDEHAESVATNAPPIPARPGRNGTETLSNSPPSEGAWVPVTPAPVPIDTEIENPERLNLGLPLPAAASVSSQ